jgi:hypothetical protein
MMALTSPRTQPRRDIERGESQPSLRTIMMAPPMSAATHAAIARQRTVARRAAEDARDCSLQATDDWSAG